MQRPNSPNPRVLSLVQVQPPTDLALATSQALATTTAAQQRKLFWSAFINWLVHATDEECEQLDRALSSHAHHVRPLIDAVTDAIHAHAGSARDAATALPPTLLAELFTAGWRPGLRRSAAQAA